MLCYFYFRGVLFCLCFCFLLDFSKSEIRGRKSPSHTSRCLKRGQRQISNRCYESKSNNSGNSKSTWGLLIAFKSSHCLLLLLPNVVAYCNCPLLLPLPIPIAYWHCLLLLFLSNRFAPAISLGSHQRASLHQGWWIGGWLGECQVGGLVDGV